MAFMKKFFDQNSKAKAKWPPVTMKAGLQGQTFLVIFLSIWPKDFWNNFGFAFWRLFIELHFPIFMYCTLKKIVFEKNYALGPMW